MMYATGCSAEETESAMVWPATMLRPAYILTGSYTVHAGELCVSLFTFICIYIYMNKRVLVLSVLRSFFFPALSPVCVRACVRACVIA